MVQIKPSHISVCICTYKRPVLLIKLLEELRKQKTNGRFTYSAVIVDNDAQQSAKNAVGIFKNAAYLDVEYYSEPEQNIALARNKAVENAKGDFIAFIDDDELPTQDWLYRLFEAMLQYDADGIQGPVKPIYDEEPPEWIIKGKFYEREIFPTGHILTWRQGRTGNILLRSSIFTAAQNRFDPAFGSGAEDQDFFRRMKNQGFLFVYCSDAVAYEIVPPIRWKKSFMLKRSLLRGKMAINHPGFGFLDLIKSIVAVFIYSISLPIMLLGGQHLFMKYLIKLFDHIGKIAALIGMDLVKEKYVTE